jgi:hypothetical protein
MLCADVLVKAIQLGAYSWLIQRSSDPVKPTADRAGILAERARYSPRTRTVDTFSKDHHRQRTFKEELVALLDKHGVEYDEQYLFD